MIKFVIPGELPDMNTILSYAKSHYGAYSKLKKDNTDYVAWVCKGLPQMDKIELVFNWYCKDRKKDIDNVSAAKKFILDGMVKAKVIKNDGWNIVLGFSDRFFVDEKNPRIEVEIREDKHGL